MADMRRFGPADLLLLLLVLAVAGGLRAGYLFSCADRSRSDGPLRVQDPSPVLTDIVPPEEMRGGERPTELDVELDDAVHGHGHGQGVDGENLEGVRLVKGPT